jgi:hypothetical protein
VPQLPQGIGHVHGAAAKVFEQPVELHIANAGVKSVRCATDDVIGECSANENPRTIS